MWQGFRNLNGDIIICGTIELLSCESDITLANETMMEWAAGWKRTVHSDSNSKMRKWWFRETLQKKKLWETLKPKPKFVLLFKSLSWVMIGAANFIFERRRTYLSVRQTMADHPAALEVEIDCWPKLDLAHWDWAMYGRGNSIFCLIVTTSSLWSISKRRCSVENAMFVY